ncbi:hypothetical protein FRB93_010060 [Tulasnella sp. JGI-2019a]|nr:hypothetical protein FRB93_010060 [Tulasnella sp. JGI-2019a]
MRTSLAPLMVLTTFAVSTVMTAPIEPVLHHNIRLGRRNWDLKPLTKLEQNMDLLNRDASAITAAQTKAKEKLMQTKMEYGSELFHSEKGVSIEATKATKRLIVKYGVGGAAVLAVAASVPIGLTVHENQSKRDA